MESEKEKKVHFFFNFNNPATTNIISKEFNNLVLVTQLYQKSIYTKFNMWLKILFLVFKSGRFHILTIDTD